MEKNIKFQGFIIRNSTENQIGLIKMYLVCIKDKKLILVKF